MDRALRWNRKFSQTRLGRAVCAALAADTAVVGFLPMLALVITGCPTSLAPTAGLPEYQEIEALPVPGPARVNAAGGNLLIMRTDLDLDTQLGPFSVGATWNSASQKWSWSFDDLSYSAGNFVDTTGAWYNVSGLAQGAAIPGTIWVKLGQYGQAGTNQLRTKGGLEYDFTTDGHPLYVHWTSSAKPYLAFSQTAQGDGRQHTTSIAQCLAPAGDCHPVFSIGYDGQGRVTQISDRAGRQALFAYDANGNLTSARDGLDVAQGWGGYRYEYTGGNLTAITNSEGERVQYQYDGAHRVTQVTQIGLGNPARTFSYQPPDSGNLYVTTFTDPLGNQTTFRYDGSAQLFEVKALATGETTTRAWANRRVTSLVLPSGVTTSWTYSNDDVQTRADPSGNVTDYAYVATGVDRASPARRPLLFATDSLGTIETRSYDPQGRLLSIANGAGDTTSFTYGTDEMAATMTRPDGVTASFSGYGEHGHASAMTVAGIQYQMEYDAVGNQTRADLDDFRPEQGGVVSRVFDEDRNVSQVLVGDCDSVSGPYLIDPDTISIEYRSDHRRTAIHRPGGGDHAFDYDALGRLTGVLEWVDGQWQTTALTYDAGGRLLSAQLPNGMRREATFDSMDRLTTLTAKRNGNVEGTATLTYQQGQLSSLYDSIRGGIERYSYDSAGRVASVTFAEGEHLFSSYDLRSRPTLQTLEMPDSSSLRRLGYAYDLADRQQVIDEDGTPILTHTYQDGHLAAETYGNGLARSYSYDSGTGRITGSLTLNGSGQTVETTAVQQIYQTGSVYLTADTTTSIGVTGTTHEGYYLSPVASSGSPPIGFEGKRVSLADLPKAYAYDSLGNLTGLGDQFTYNAESNRLLSATVDNVQVPYTYDEAGFATSRGGIPLTWTANGRLASYGSSTSLLWDMLGRLISSTVAGQQIRWRFGGLVLADAAGNPTAIELGEAQIQLAGGHLYRHGDFRGNVKFVTDDTAQVVAHYEYGPYGVANVLGSSADPVGFAQQLQIGSLMILGVRIYDPLVGRFLSPDPILDVVNQYDYAHGNPIWFSDPTGAFPTLTYGDWEDFFEDASWVSFAFAFFTPPPGDAFFMAAGIGFQGSKDVAHHLGEHYGTSTPVGSGAPPAAPSRGSGAPGAPGAASGPPASGPLGAPGAAPGAPDGGGGAGPGAGHDSPPSGGPSHIGSTGDGYISFSCSPTSMSISRPPQLQRAAMILGSIQILLAAAMLQRRRRRGAKTRDSRTRSQGA